MAGKKPIVVLSPRANNALGVLNMQNSVSSSSDPKLIQPIAGDSFAYLDIKCVGVSETASGLQYQKRNSSP
jgi:hypothetical protein